MPDMDGSTMIPGKAVFSQYCAGIRAPGVEVLGSIAVLLINREMQREPWIDHCPC